MIEEKKATVAVPAIATPVPAAPQAIPAIVDSTNASPVVLSQAPPMGIADAKPAVDKPSSVVPSPFAELK
ncbi:MAG TPA: hypothetical protein VMU54_18345 [Planctomycetota bacterium]|nr:hypothetical protein [Planctomycetota bacterium]